MKGAYGTRGELTATTRGKAHEYLGMAMGFRRDGACMLSQHGCTKKQRSELPERWEARRRNAPAPEGLLKIGEKSPRLGAKQARERHQAAAEALRA